ncbi:MAG: alpha/beta hydrolase [Actinomycetota bacterium]|nr:alpha/beta hydrolase [Actinomycetota bacterium]
MSEVVERSVDANGIRFNVAEVGTGEPVVLLHGFPDSWHIWRHQMPVLAKAGFRVIAPDLRGFGRSARPVGVARYTMRTLVADVVSLLDTHSAERVSLVGHDWGAGLAWAVAAFVPDRVSRLAVVSVGHPKARIDAGLEQRQLSWYMLWFLFPGVAEEILPRDDWDFFRRWAWPSGSSEGDLQRQIADLSRPGALTAGLSWYRANIDPGRYVTHDPNEAPFPDVTCPTMGVWSSDDFALAERQMKASGRYVDGPWRYERIEGVDHWVPVNAAVRLNELLLSFLRT